MTIGSLFEVESQLIISKELDFIDKITLDKFTKEIEKVIGRNHSFKPKAYNKNSHNPLHKIHDTKLTIQIP